MDIADEDMLKCLQCGGMFRTKRAGSKFCSEACQKAYSRDAAKLKNLTYEGVLIRGQHLKDVPPTPHGIIQADCSCCGKPFSRWLESKLARLVRNEMEGSIHWEGRMDNAQQAIFEEMMGARRWEVKFCSDECLDRGIATKPLKVRILTPKAVENDDKTEENGQKTKPKRRGA